MASKNEPSTSITKDTNFVTYLLYEDYQGFGYLLVALSAFIFSIVFYHFAFQADIFVNGDYTTWDPACGFTTLQFVYFLFGTYFLPYAIIFMLIFMSHSYKNMPHDAWYKMTLYGVLAAAAFAGAVVSGINSNDVINCIGMFCTIDSGISTGRPAGTSGAIIGMNLVFFFIAIFMLLFFLLLLILVSLFRSRGVVTAFTHESHERTPLVTQSENVNGKYNSVNNTSQGSGMDVSRVRKYVHNHIAIDQNSRFQEFALITMVFTAFYPFFIVACTMLPDWIFYFTKYDIQKFQALRPADDLDIFFTVVPANTPPIVPKLYLDILVYYAAIYLVAGIALLAMVYESLRHVLHLRLSKHICLGQALVGFVFFALLAGEFCYWFLVHGYEGQSRTLRSNAELTARALGQVANVVIGLLVLPVSKNSFWNPLFGVSWESTIIYHQIMGYTLLLVLLAHMFAWWYVYSEQHSFPSDILAVPMTVSCAKIPFLI